MKSLGPLATGLLLALLFCPATGAGDDDKSAGNSPPDKRYDLKYRFRPGEVLRSEVIHRVRVETTIQGTSQTAETRTKSIKIWRVKEVSPLGVATFVYSVDNIDMWQKTQGRQEVRYNSRTDKEVPPGYETVAAAVGVPLSVIVMDDHGRIIRREEKRTQPVGVSTQVTMPLPDHPLAIGETWSEPMELTLSVKQGVTRKVKTRELFTLQNVEDGLATVRVDTQVLTPLNDPELEAQLIQRLSSGTVRFDIAAGRIKDEQLDLDRRVVGFNGAASSMHYQMRFTEKLVSANIPGQASPKAPPETAAKPSSRPAAPQETPAAEDNTAKAARIDSASEGSAGDTADASDEPPPAASAPQQGSTRR